MNDTFHISVPGANAACYSREEGVGLGVRAYSLHESVGLEISNGFNGMIVDAQGFMNQ